MARKTPRIGRFLDPKETQRRIRAHKKAGSDYAAARILKMPRPTYTLWRERYGLPSKQGARAAEDLRTRKRVLKQEPNTRAAAKRLGMDHQALYIWMRRHGIKPKPAPMGSRMSNEEVERRLRIIRDSGSVREAAKRLHRSIPSVYQFLQSHGVKPPQPPND